MQAVFSIADAVRYVVFFSGGATVAGLTVGLVRSIRVKAWPTTCRALASIIGVSTLLTLVAQHFGEDTLHWPSYLTGLVVSLILLSIILGPGGSAD